MCLSDREKEIDAIDLELFRLIRRSDELGPRGVQLAAAIRRARRLSFALLPLARQRACEGGPEAWASGL